MNGWRRPAGCPVRDNTRTGTKTPEHAVNQNDTSHKPVPNAHVGAAVTGRQDV